MALRKSGNLAEAELTFEKLVEEWPDSVAHWTELGLTRIERGHVEEAVKALEAAARLAPGDIGVLMNQGNAYLQLVDRDPERAPAARKARTVFERVLKFLPRGERATVRANALVGLARSYVREDPGDDEMVERALAHYKEALGLDPRCFEALIGSAMIYYDYFDSEDGRRQAREHLGRAEAIRPREEWPPAVRKIYEEIDRE